MDFNKMATEVTVFLTPFLPYLVPAVEATAKEAGKKFGEAAWTKAKSLWGRLNDVAQRDAKVNSAVTGLAEDPTDEDYQLIFAKALAKQIEAAPELATALVSLMKDDQAVQRVLIEQGSRVKNIHQRLSKAGVQETTVRGSAAGHITQEQ
jgi:hypothetical protein